MKAFIAVLSLAAVAVADQTSSQSFTLGGHSRGHTSTHTPGPRHQAAPAHPAPAPYRPAPTYRPAPYRPAPTYAPPAPTYAPPTTTAAPVYETTTTTAAPTYAPPAPTYAPAPAYKPAVVYRPAPTYAPAPAYKPAPTYAPRPAYKPAPAYQEPAYPDVPAQYEYAYAVQDDYAGVDFDANEARDHYNTQGQYRVALPDGRIQTVTYRVEDAGSGYIADVVYTGEARYDEPAPYHPAPKPTYN